VRCAYTVPHGATLVLAPHASDADWLNMQRPVFARRKLRVILWCDAETTLALKRTAVDFFDWISHRHECPPGVPAFAVEGIRSALRARAEGIVWLGGDLDACLQAALYGRELLRVSAAQRYAELLGALRTVGPKWVGWTELTSPHQLRRVRWAMAEVGRRTRVLLIEPKVAAPGWWPVNGCPMPLNEARERLERAGAKAPGRLAALLGLEPDGVAITVELLVTGAAEQEIEATVQKASDPGAALVCMRNGLGTMLDPPVLRATQGAGLREAGVADEVEAALWKHDPRDWKALTVRAMEGGDVEVMRQWVSRALAAGGEDDGTTLLLAGRAALRGGRELEARTYLNRSIDIASRNSTTEVLVGARASLAEIEAARENVEHVATVWAPQGRDEEAEHLARDALSTDESMFGPDGPARPHALRTLGQILVRRGRSAEATDLFREAIGIHEERSGRDHPMIGDLWADVADASLTRGMYADAEAAARTGITILESALGTEHHRLCKPLWVLANALARRGIVREALTQASRGLALAEKAADDEAAPAFRDLIAQLSLRPT
jgi:tetratricopeptide (TPR) repeat protein